MLEGVGVQLAGVTAPGAEQSHSPGQGAATPRPSWAPAFSSRSACRILSDSTASAGWWQQCEPSRVEPAREVGTGPFLRSVTPHSAPDLLPSAQGAHAEPSPDPGPGRGLRADQRAGRPLGRRGALSQAAPASSHQGFVLGPAVLPGRWGRLCLAACAHLMITGRGPGHKRSLPVPFA